ncbi:IMPG2 protein, partial [Amia calva]|nr:IMPG2 protein [Amia calva]
MDTKSTDAYTDTVTTVPTHKSNPSDPDSPRPAVTRLGTSTAATSVTPSVAPSTFHPTPAGGGTVVYSKTGGRTAHSFTTWPTSQTTSSPQALTPSVWGGVVASGATPTSYKSMGPAVDPPTPATPPHGPTSLSPDRRTSRTTTVPGMSTRPSTDRTSRAETRPGLDPTSSRTQRPSTPQGRSSSAPPGQQDRTSAPLRTSLKPRVAGDKSRVFITGDQPPVIKEETLRVPLTIVLETGDQSTQRSLQPEQLQEDTVRQVEPFLQRAPGYHDLQVSTTSGWEVLYCDALFGTGAALLWLGRPGEPLNATGLSEAVRRGLYIAGVRVHNITVSEPQADMCSWLFLCPPGFQCIPSGVGNASCSSLCHMDYCKHSGICTHHHSQQPVCQCPVGEDFWFMGQRCDFRMTRQRMVGIALGALLSVAVVMAMLSFLAYRRFKAMLIQAKVDQTRSSYRRFSRFDDLSGRFWTQSWPGSSVDSLDNPAFSRSDELLHLRALDRTCCYHDDSISLSSTCQGSRTHLNTVYTPSSHYNWGLSNGSINDCMADSGKASDLSVCSWPIEPIQWTPFPLLQQLGIQRAAKTPRPRSYCEGMELVDLERTWTA